MMGVKRMNQEKEDRIIELLEEISSKLDDLKSECSSTTFEASYTSNVRDVAEQILDYLKKN